MYLSSVVMLALSTARFVVSAPTHGSATNATVDAAADAAEAAAAWEKFTSEAGSLTKRAVVTMILTKDSGFNGEGELLYGTNSQCYDLRPGFNDVASSLTLAKDYICITYADSGCRGDARVWGAPGYPTQSTNLETVGFNDVISSYLCIPPRNA